MFSFAHALHALQLATPPAKHMRRHGPRGETYTVEELSALERLGLSLEGIVEACKKRKADPHDVIAYALTEEARENAKENGMTLREQARLSFDLINKAEPSKRAVETNVDITSGGRPFVFSKDDENL